MPTPLSVVIVATADCAQVLLEVLRRGGFEPHHVLAGTPAQLTQALAQNHWELLLASDHVSEFSLEKVLALAQPLGLPVLVLARVADVETARALVGAGAMDVIWPAHLERLPVAVDRARLARPTNDASFQPDVFARNSAVQLLVDPQTGQVVDANPAAAEFYGYPIDQLRHMLVGQLSTSDPDQVSEIEAQPPLVPGGVVASKHRLATGELRDVEVRASLVRQGERPLLYSIINDVTDQRHRERELEAVAAFAAALRGAPSRFALATAIVEQLRKLTGARRAALALRDPNSGEVVTEMALNWPQTNGTRKPPGTGLAGRVIAAGRVEWSEQELPSSLSGPEVLAIGVPLVAQGQTLGALCFSSETPPGPDQLRLLERDRRYGRQRA